MDNERRKELLQKLKDGTLTGEDERELWNLKGTGQIDPSEDDEPDLDIYNRLEGPSGMQESLDRIVAYQTNRVRRKKQLSTMYRVAAGMAAVFLLYFGFTKFSGKIFFPDAPVFVTIEVRHGSVKKLVLPDSSIATISPGSVLRYPETFAGDERKIYLDRGEAFFEVIKNPDKPFRVQSGELQTTALGTSFTVQYDPLLKREKVNLYTGKVSVESMASANEQPNVTAVVLTPGKAYESLQGKVMISDFRPDGSNPVAKGLVFDEVPFEEAMYRIGSWHGISISVDGRDVKNSRISGDFNNKDIGEILSILSFSYQFEFTKTDSLTYKIKSR